MIRMIHMIATFLSLLPLRLMIFLIWGVINFLCLWIMIRKFYVILILLSLFMIPLKIIMRGEHMLIDISIISSSLSLCCRFRSCTCFSFLCLLLCASMNYYIAIFLCIGNMLDVNVLGICFFMLTFVLQPLFLREHH